MKKKLLLTLTLAFTMSASTFAQTEPTVLEEGGTGPYKAVMYEVEGFKEHTIFAPKDLSVFNATAHKNYTLGYLRVDEEKMTIRYKLAKLIVPVIPSISYSCRF